MPALTPGTLVPITLFNGGVVNVEVCSDGYSKGVEHETGPWRMVDYYSDWASSDDVMDSLQGITRIIGGQVSWPGPHAYPGNPKLKCLSVSAVGLGPPRPDTKLWAADFVKISCRYAIPIWDTDGINQNSAFNNQPVPFGEYHVRGYTEKVPVPRGGAKFGTSGDPVPVAMHLDVPIKQYTLVRHQFPINPEPYLDPLEGKLNATTFWGKPRGTIKFEEYDYDEERDTNGNSVLRVECRLRYRQYDWNMMISDTGFSFQLVQDNSGNYRYGYAEMNVFPLIS